MGIVFGTDGWRDIIADGFTYASVRQVAAAHAQVLRQQGGRAVVVAFDTRFQGAGFAWAAAETLAAHGLHVHLAPTFLPTPVLSYAVVHLQAAGGVMITASHNPPQYSGYKVKGAYGGSATPALVQAIEAALQTPEPYTGPAGRIEPFDVQGAYFAQLDHLLDLPTLRQYRGRFMHDAMGGAGAGWLEAYLQSRAIPVAFEGVRQEPTPLFYGVNPEPVPQNLAVLAERLAGESGMTFAAVTDGDADRVGAVTAGGRFFNSHQIFAVLLAHLHRRGLRGRVVKTVSGSSLIDRLATTLDLPLLETPVGFKFITDAFLEGQLDERLAVMIGGEESGGLSMRGHIPERDGLLNSLLLLEAVAASGAGLDAQFAALEAQTGFRHVYGRNDLHLQDGYDKAALLARARAYREVGGHPVTGVNDRDGVKLLLDGGTAFAMFRASGTEPVVRVYVEAQSDADLQVILQDATRRVTDER